MKGAAIIFLCAVVSIQALSDEQKTKLKTYSEECSKLHKVDKETITNARNGIFAETVEFKDYLFCLSKKIGFQNEAGDVQIEAIKNKATSEFKDTAVVEDLVKTCAVKKATPQETAFEIAKCYHKHKVDAKITA